MHGNMMFEDMEGKTGKGIRKLRPYKEQERFEDGQGKAKKTREKQKQRREDKRKRWEE